MLNKLDGRRTDGMARRQRICELLLDNHPEDCQTCERDGNCELQRLAYNLGVDDAGARPPAGSAGADD